MSHKRVWTLYRVSTDKQHDGNDIPLQKNACREFIDNQKDWKLEKELYEMGVSGFKKSAKERDALETIRNAAANNEFDILLVFMFDRLGRRHDETPFVVEALTKFGIEVWSVKEGHQKFNSHVDSLLNYITFWQASGESIKTSQRVTEALEQMNEDGRFTGGTVPYGYELVDTGIPHHKKDKTIKDLKINPIEADLIKIIFDLVLTKGYGASRIAQWLNENGYKTRNGSPWRHNYITRILKNSIYCGYKRYGYYDKDKHVHMDRVKKQPYNENYVIIKLEDFEKVQEIINKRRIENKSDNSYPTKSQLLLSGIAYCGYCGAKLASDYSVKSWKRKTDGEISKWRTLRYVCKHGKDSTEYHEVKQFGAVTFEKKFVAHLKKFIENLDNNGYIEKRSRYQTELVSAKNQLINQLESEQKEAHKELAAIKNLLIKVELGQSKLSVDQVEDMLIEKENEIKERNIKIDELKSELNNLNAELKKYDDTYSKLNHQWLEEFDKADLEKKKMMVASVFDRVILWKNKIKAETIIPF
jgi:site-specific DNA recombinase